MPTSTDTVADDTQWPVWDADTTPADLGRYIVPDVVKTLGTFREGGGESSRAELEHLWAALRANRIGYAFERALTADGQTIRPPAEVLAAPGSGTCLDLALVLAGACALAGLPAAVIVLDPTEPGRVRHAVVAVGLGGNWPDELPNALVWSQQPDDFLGRVRADWSGPPRPIVVLDPVGIAQDLGTTRTLGANATMSDAVAAGHRYVSDPAWQWRVGVLTGHPHPYRPAQLPTVLPIRSNYRKPETAESALRLLRPEYEVTPFQSRDELRVLEDFADQIAVGRRTGVAVIHGVGGAGKTRLALELAERMRHRGWYTGPLRDDLTDPTAIAWLATVTAPLLVIVDYADARTADTQSLLQTLAARTSSTEVGPPALVVLTARSTEGEWLPELLGSLTADSHPHVVDDTDLPAVHPYPDNIYFRTFRSLISRELVQPSDTASAAPPALPEPEPGTRWTTLDLVLQGWVAAQGGAQLPSTRGQLYDQVLDHEQRYWARSYTRITGQPSPNRELLADAAAALTLLTPLPGDADDALRGVGRLADSAEWRDNVVRALTSCLSPGTGQGIAIRPDPVGDHHLITRLTHQPQLLDKVVPRGADSTLVVQAVIVLSRAAQNHRDAAVRSTQQLLDIDPNRWPILLAAANSIGGPALTTLEHTVADDDCPLPFDELSNALAYEPAGLVHLAALIDQRRLDRTPAADHPRRAALLLELSHRQSLVGDRTAALGAISQAVVHYRQLAQANPAAYRPDLAASLNNLSNQQSDAGDRDAALNSITEAVAYYRKLAQTNPAAYRPNLAGALNNLSVRQSGAGDHDAALNSSTEAVAIRRQLAQTNPAAFLPNLAISLNNLSNHQRNAGDRDAALHSITDAVTHYRQLARANPAAFLPNLAASLNNLSNQQSGAGDRDAALNSITEAVAIRRQLAQANPAAFLPDLAGALNNLSVQQSDAGDRDAALHSITDAVTHYRQLAQTNPAAFLPDLAMSLNNLSVQQSNAGDRDAALHSITDAVTHYRQLAQTNPAAFLPNLASSLNNLSNRQSDAGDRDAALNSITDAVTHYRQLAQTNPAAFLPDLAMSLNNLSVQQSNAGDRDAALNSITDAVTHYRQLARANPAAFLPDLAMSLNNLSVQQSNAGDRDAALNSITDAVTHYRQLAQTNPAAFLPNLASSLNNLSNHQRNAGDRDAALNSITEAVAIRRQLAQANPAAFLPDLAGALNNLSVQQGDAGDRDAALHSITDAVAYYRQLARANLVAFLPDLAMSLNNQSTGQSNAGDRDAALRSSTEAVTHYRQLAQANPAAYLPDLASTLNNLSNRQSDAGDRDAALNSITEAVAIRRQLAQANPAAFLPDLASTLNNLSNRQSDAGDRDAALNSITDAVTHYRQLAQANPAAYRPNLAGALSNLSVRQSDAGNSATALTSSTEAVTHYRQLAQANPAAFLPALAGALNVHSSALGANGHERQLWPAAIEDAQRSSARAYLRAAWAHHLADHEHSTAALAEIVHAAADADQPPDDRTDVIVSQLARWLIRQLNLRIASDEQSTLPMWATAPLPDGHIAIANSYAAAQSWEEVEDLLQHNAELLRLEQPAVRKTLTALTALYADSSAPHVLAELLDEIQDSDLETVLARHRDDNTRLNLLNTWISTPTWTESRAILIDHVGELTDPAIRELLLSIDSPTTRQHLAILDLTNASDPDTAYGIVTNPDAAENIALNAIEHGDLDLARTVALASDGIDERPATVGLISAVVLLAADRPDDAAAVATQLAELASSTQRRAHVIRLTALRNQRPDLTGIEQLIHILRPSSTEAPQSS